jgi:hypothetical protein
MRPAPIRLALWLLLGVGCLDAAAEDIPWNANRPLAWSDFNGAVPARTPSEDVAITAASLGWEFDYSLARSTETCTYEVTSIRAVAVFHQDRSWSKPDHRTDRVLEHEQRHFDITQLHKWIFEARVREHVGSIGECRGRNARRAAESIGTAIDQHIGPIYERVWAEYTQMQAAYDAETAHGTDAAEQERWSARIEAALRDRQRQLISALGN